MNGERYPADLIVTEQDFANCGWQAILDSTTRDGYQSMRQSFTAAAEQALKEGRKLDGKIFWMLADACSMMLSPKSANEPFKPSHITKNYMMPFGPQAYPIKIVGWPFLLG